MNLVNYYHVLGISKNANSKEVKIAYRNLAKIWHPDKNKDPKAHEKIVLLNEAYEIIFNSEKRSIYNKLYEEAFEKSDVKVYTEYDSSKKAEKQYAEYEPSPENREDYEKLQNWISEIKEKFGKFVYYTAKTGKAVGDIFSSLFALALGVAIIYACSQNVYYYFSGIKEVSIIRMGLSLLFLLFLLFILIIVYTESSKKK